MTQDARNATRSAAVSNRHIHLSQADVERRAAAAGAEGAGGAGRAASGRRLFVTERDVSWYAHDGKALSDGDRYLLTPAALDRAKALGIWREAR